MPTVTVKWELILEELKKLLDVAGIKKEIDDLKKAKFYQLPKEALDIVIKVIVAVEYIVTEIMAMSGEGSEKRKAVVKFLDDVFDLPFYLEPFDGIVFGMAVDAVVTALNTFLGKTWIKEAAAKISIP